MMWSHEACTYSKQGMCDDLKWIHSKGQMSNQMVENLYLCREEGSRKMHSSYCDSINILILFLYKVTCASGSEEF